MLSHLPHLVRLNRSRVGFPSWCGSFGPVRMQQSHSVRTKSGPNKQSETSLERWTLERFVCGENAIRTQTDPTAKITLWDEEVFVDSLQCSMAGRGQTWGCEEVRSLIELW